MCGRTGNPKQITIRIMRAEDAERVAVLSGQLGYPSTSDELRRRFENIVADERHAVFIAELSDGTVIGWIHLYICSLIVDHRRAEIWGLVVDQAYRCQGIGGILMDQAEEWARQRECRSIYLRSNVVRNRAHRFYENLGYSRVKTQHVFGKNL